MPFKLRKLKITKVDLCASGANPDADIAIFKSRDAELPPVRKTSNQEDTPVPKKIDLAKDTPEEIAAYVAGLEKTITDQEAELEKAKKPPTKKTPADPAEPDADDVMKSLPEPVRKMVMDLKKTAEDAVAAAKAAQVQVEKTEKDVQKARDEAELVTLKKTVETDMPKIPGSVDEIAKLLQEGKATLTAASYAVLEKALKAGSAAIAKAEKEIGGSGGDKTGSAIEEINKRADELVEKKICKTRPEAIQQVAEEDQELYKRYKDEKKAAR